MRPSPRWCDRSPTRPTTPARAEPSLVRPPRPRAGSLAVVGGPSKMERRPRSGIPARGAFFDEGGESPQRPVIADMDGRVHDRAHDVADRTRRRFLPQGDDARLLTADDSEGDDGGDQRTGADLQPEEGVVLDVEHLCAVRDPDRAD